MIFISEAEEQTDRYSCVQTLTPTITYVEDTSDEEAKEMAPKTDKSLRELMRGGTERLPHKKPTSPSHQ